MIQDSREDFFLQLLADYVLLNELLGGNNTEQFLHKIGIKYGLRLEDRYRSASDCSKNLTVEQFSNLISRFAQSIGGEYVLQAADEEKVVIYCYRCPFGHVVLKTPVLCAALTAMLGGIASRNFPYSKVSREHSIAKKAANCQIVIYLQETETALAAAGNVYADRVVNYVLTPSEIELMNNEVLAGNNIYHKYVASFESLKSKHQFLETEYNQLRNEIFSDLGLGVLTVNEAGKITYMNKEAQELLPVGENWDVGSTKIFQSLLHETLTKHTHFKQHQVQIPFPAEVRVYSVNTAPLFHEEGGLSGAVCVFQDETKIRALENELLQMEKFSLVAELAAGIAHEIRNPITTLRGFLQILSKEFRHETKGAEYCAMMIEEIDRANSILKEFLLLTKPTAPKVREVDLHVVLEEIFLLIESKSLLENVEISKCYAKKLPLVKVDPAHMKQVFLNLATNAIQAMPDGGRLTISTSEEKGKAVVRFSDTGFGMEESQLKKIFDPFFSTKEQGTGLGLTVSYRLIEAHNGKLYAESTPGRGSVFTLELPVFRNEE
ncbi:MAG: PAS domain-containing protein [Dethiobacter sp.]|jgi:signal transduction histidine kinase|nr:PAS domain-containing protein [Dethiobacter sp.]MBS3989315.1 PAS domain-containing protein [Dethiobacter sp.]